MFVAHKGLPLVNFDPAFNHPDDIVAVSRQFPDMNFVVYHAAWDPSHIEGPYDPTATVGIDSLLAALDRHNVPPNDNVWVDLATVWRQLLTQPDQAAHALGKLLSRVGQHRVMWGTDAIWYGSPQPQIMAMRAFQITAEFQDLYGYPALTDELKAAIFGLNARPPLRYRPDRHSLWADHGSAHGQYRRVGPTSPRRRGPIGVGPRTGRRPAGRSCSWLASPTTRWVPFRDARARAAEGADGVTHHSVSWSTPATARMRQRADDSGPRYVSAASAVPRAARTSGDAQVLTFGSGPMASSSRILDAPPLCER